MSAHIASGGGPETSAAVSSRQPSSASYLRLQACTDTLGTRPICVMLRNRGLARMSWSQGPGFRRGP